MKLFEAIADYGHKIDSVIQAVAKDVLKYDMTRDEATSIAKSLSLSKLLALDTALSDNDVATVAAILGTSSLEEYSLGGMAGRSATSGLKSSASSRNEKNRRTDSSTNSSNTKPAGANNIKSTAQSQTTIKPDGSKSAEEDAEDKEQAEKDEKLANDIENLKKKAGLK